MSLSQATITSGPLFTLQGASLLVSWESSSPDGTVFQLYANGELVWWGAATSVLLPRPETRTMYIVGTVDADEAATDLSSDLPDLSSDGWGGAASVKLTWLGGTYLDDDIQGFHVYGEASPGDGIDYNNVLSTVEAYPFGIYQDGWGMGGWGEGGWGRAASEYEWISDPLSSGTWAFAVKPFDAAGNEGPAQTGTFAVASAPRPPAAYGAGYHANRRPTYVLNPDGTATITWLASL